MATYSAFFSSGLLAPHHSYQTFHDLSSNAHSCYDAPSPITPSSPFPDSDIEFDIEREVTPTRNDIPRSNSTSSSSSHGSSKTGGTSVPNIPQTQSRLRKRRSSLTVASNPMNAIRSPTRAAGAALQLQMHLTSPSRSRSGSLNVSTHHHPDPYGMPVGSSTASQGTTSIMGRMRSGSVGTALRPRRGVRRLAGVPAAAPPPTAPLPAVPSFLVSPLQDWNGPLSAPLSGSFSRSAAAPRPSDANTNAHPRPPLAIRTLSDTTTYDLQTTKGRERSFSLSQELRIDEEMKENN